MKKKHKGDRLPVPPRRKYEDSPADKKQDKRGAKKLGMSMKDYENSPQDRAEDAAAAGPMPGPNEFSPAQETAMRQGARASRMPPPDDMGEM